MDLNAYLTAIGAATGGVFVVTWAILRTQDDAFRTRFGPVVALGVGFVLSAAGLWAVGAGRADVPVFIVGWINASLMAMGVQNVASRVGLSV